MIIVCLKKQKTKQTILRWAKKEEKKRRKKTQKQNRTSFKRQFICFHGISVEIQQDMSNME